MSGTVTNLNEAVQWLSYTYMYSLSLSLSLSLLLLLVIVIAIVSHTLADYFVKRHVRMLRNPLMYGITYTQKGTIQVSGFSACLLLIQVCGHRKRSIVAQLSWADGAQRCQEIGPG